LSNAYASSAIDNLSVAMLILCIGILWVRSLGRALLLFALQSLMLAAAAVCAGLAMSSTPLLVGAGLTAAIKGIAAPTLLWVVLQRIPTTHDVQALIGRRTGIVVAVVLAIVFAQTFDGQPFVTAIGAQRVLATAVTVMVIGIQIMVTRRQAITQALGFLVIENGMALAALTATYGIPFGVELGVFLDLLLAVFVVFVYTGRMHVIFGSVDTEHMRSLRG